MQGTSLVEVVETTKDDRIRIQVGKTQTEFHGMGVYRFDTDAGVLRVFGGEAEVQAGSNRIVAGRGRQVSLRERACHVEIQSESEGRSAPVGGAPFLRAIRFEQRGSQAEGDSLGDDADRLVVEPGFRHAVLLEAGDSRLRSHAPPGGASAVVPAART